METGRDDQTEGQGHKFKTGGTCLTDSLRRPGAQRRWRDPVFSERGQNVEVEVEAKAGDKGWKFEKNPEGRITQVCGRQRLKSRNFYFNSKSGPHAILAISAEASVPKSPGSRRAAGAMQRQDGLGRDRRSLRSPGTKTAHVGENGGLDSSSGLRGRGGGSWDLKTWKPSV